MIAIYTNIRFIQFQCNSTENLRQLFSECLPKPDVQTESPTNDSPDRTDKSYLIWMILGVVLVIVTLLTMILYFVYRCCRMQTKSSGTTMKTEESDNELTQDSYNKSSEQRSERKSSKVKMG